MTDFTDEYLQLLIKQYYDKPKASGEIVAKAATWEKIRDVYADFPAQFDIDAEILETELGLFGGFVLGFSDGSVLGVAGQSAIGYQLDIIGKIVGLTRQSIGENINDETYRLMLKVKIGQNTASAFMVSDTRISIQDVINLAFNGEGVVTDKQDMSLTLYIQSETISPTFINLIINNRLLPKPQGVQYNVVANTGGGTPFGVKNEGEPDSPNILGVGNVGGMIGGELASLYS